MHQEHPLLLVALLGASAVAGRWWWSDFQAARRGAPAERLMPGVTSAPWPGIGLAVAGVLVLVAAETFGEQRLGLTGQQSQMTVLFGLYTLAAAFVEELIFRGYLVVEHRGRSALIAGIMGASLLFALLHPFLWSWQDGALSLRLTPKGWFSTAALFAGSLWFYLVRYWSLNPTRSLWPCFVAHLAKNLGVFAIKYAQGFVTGWW